VTPEEAKREADLEEADLLGVMSTPGGRRLFFALIERSGVMGGAFDRDPGTMAFLEGRRSVGIELVQRLQMTTPKEYLRMMTEAAQTAVERSMKAAVKQR
jgi:hypothetical protein